MYSRAYQRLIQLPPLLWTAVFLLVPYLFLFCFSFWQVRSQTIVHDWNIGNFLELTRNPVYLEVLLRSARIAASVTLLALLLGFPLAYFLAFKAGRSRTFLYQLVIIPLWVSYLVRAYAWKTILGSDGVMNRLLEYTGLIHQPIGALLYSPFAVVLTLTHIYTPFVFLPVYASLAHIPKSLLEASQDLGASAFRSFWTIVFPLALPGVLAGATFAFVLALGDFLAPLLIGGPNGIMISNLVVSLFGAAYDWPLGAAISLGMLILVVLLITGTEGLERRLRERGAAV
jgi:spermidine/putrescine transport system permease protein